jgi:branched-subunit amino acid transport protein
MDEFLLILGMMLVTFSARYPVMAMVGRIDLPERVLRALRYVPVAVLTAITIPELFIREGQFAITIANAYLVGGIVSIVIAWRFRNLLLTIIVGMGTFLLWRAIFGAI